MLISYEGYSPPKCSCNGKHTHSSEFMIPTLMSKCPIPWLESSPTPSRMPKPSMRKHCFQSKRFLFLKTKYQFLIKFYWTTLRGELLENSPKQSWVILRDELLDNSLRQFFGKSSHQIHLITMFFMSCTHTYCSRLPQCIWNAICHFTINHVNISPMHILTKIIHKQHVIHS